MALCMSALPRSKLPQRSRMRAAGQLVVLRRLSVRGAVVAGTLPLTQATACVAQKCSNAGRHGEHREHRNDASTAAPQSRER